MNLTLSHRESDENYAYVVARLNDSWRVIVCKDGIQWILQFVKISRRGADWRARSFHRSRDALISVSAASAGGIDPAAIAILEALPRMIGRCAINDNSTPPFITIGEMTAAIVEKIYLKVRVAP